MPLLEVRRLETHFRRNGRTFKAVDGLDLTVEHGETVALVGESGCGKSVTAFSILGLIPDPPGRIVGGEIFFDGRDLLKLHARAIRSLRGNQIGIIFQEPMTSLNPVLTIGNQISEAIREHQPLSRQQARWLTLDLLDQVGLPQAHHLLREYPHQLSGGMRQRIMIAMALSCSPKLLIADEPTTALDVTTQAQILELLRSLQKKMGMAILFITHDLGVVAQIARRVIVMYAGKKVEEGPAEELFERPIHPYTRGLLASLPDPTHDSVTSGRPNRLYEIPGMVPPLDQLPVGCAYAPRCEIAVDGCWTAPIPLVEFGHRCAACLRCGP